MKLYIRVWPDQSASIITSDGTQLWTFSNIGSAITACRDWYQITDDQIIYDHGLRAI